MLTAEAADSAVPTTIADSATPTIRNDFGPSSLREGLLAQRVPGLDAIRAIAAMLVVYNHLGISWMPAGLGVLAFFVLSGFLITWLLLKEYERYGGIALRLFYIRR